MTTRPRIRLVPPLGVLLALAALGGVVVFVRSTEATGERAFDNVLTALCVLLAALIYGLWFLLRGGLTGRGRALVLTAFVLAAGLIVATVRIDGWSGSSVPDLRFVWQPKPRPELPAGTQLVASNAEHRIDIATTTPLVARPASVRPRCRG
jgi:hypothetical protein